jgi:hypothetical protein
MGMARSCSVPIKTRLGWSLEGPTTQQCNYNITRKMHINTLEKMIRGEDQQFEMSNKSKLRIFIM